MKILLHCCCGPCSIMPSQLLQKEGHELTAFFYNPNIHPYQEYVRRRDTLINYLKEQNTPLILQDSYDLADFLLAVSSTAANNANKKSRCAICYEMRLENTAKTAEKEGFDCFATTLTVSPYQDHQLLQEVGQKIGKKYGIEYKYTDFRPYFRQGQKQAKELGLYRQGYCGCIYSEKERYCK